MEKRSVVVQFVEGDAGGVSAAVTLVMATVAGLFLQRRLGQLVDGLHRPRSIRLPLPAAEIRPHVRQPHAIAWHQFIVR